MASPRKTIVLQSASLKLETRRQNELDASFTRRRPLVGSHAQELEYDRIYGDRAKRRHVGPCNTYNCHGLTFGARRSSILSDVDMILEDDDYAAVEYGDVLPGDIVVYYSTGKKGGVAGDPEHSGIVVERTLLNSIKVLSKWGYGDERVHWLKECDYDVDDIRFFRINDHPNAANRRPFAGRKRLLDI
jgi:hypothetical protein